MSNNKPPLLDHCKVYWDTFRMFGEQTMIRWHMTIPGMPPYRGAPGPMPNVEEDIITPGYDTDQLMYDPEKVVEVNDKLLDFLDGVYKDNCLY